MKRFEMVPPSNLFALPVKPGGAHLARASAWLGGTPDAFASETGWLLATAGRPAVDVTRAFRVLSATAEAGTDPLPPEARRYEYVMVGEPLGAYVPGYLSENFRALRERDLSTRPLPIQSGLDSEAGIDAVGEAIMQASFAGRKVVVVAHGRGAVDVVEALSAWPELASLVRALVALQAPFGGSLLASALRRDDDLSTHFGGPLRRLMDRHPDSLSSMTYAARQDCIAQHPLPLDVPMVCLATTGRAPGSTLQGVEDVLLERYGHASDGLVAPEDAVLPGARLVRLEGMDHLQSVVPAARGATHPRAAELTLALVALGLRMPPPAALSARAAA